MTYDNINVLLTKEEIAEKVEELGAKITADFDGKDVMLIGVLKGSFIFMADLVRAIDLPVQMDFISAKSYFGTTSTGVVDVKLDTHLEFAGKTIMLVEDILDTGKTLSVLKQMLLSRGASEVKIATFLDKPARRTIDIKADYCCYTIEDRFVVGYGLDYNEEYRNLDYLGEVIL